MVALALTAGLSLTAFAAEPEDAPQGASGSGSWQNPFADVHEGDWYYHNIEFTNLNGLFSGTGDTTFSPGTPMTRGMLVTVLDRMAGADVSGCTSSFSDVRTVCGMGQGERHCLGRRRQQLHPRSGHHPAGHGRDALTVRRHHGACGS